MYLGLACKAIFRFLADARALASHFTAQNSIDYIKKEALESLFIAKVSKHSYKLAKFVLFIQQCIKRLVSVLYPLFRSEQIWFQ